MLKNVPHKMIDVHELKYKIWLWYESFKNMPNSFYEILIIYKCIFSNNIKTNIDILYMCIQYHNIAYLIIDIIFIKLC